MINAPPYLFPKHSGHEINEAEPTTVTAPTTSAATMVGAAASRPSVRDREKDRDGDRDRDSGRTRQEKHPQKHAKAPVSLNTRARHPRDDDGSSSDRDRDREQEDEGLTKIRDARKTTRTKATTSKTLGLAASRSLPNLVVHTKNNSSIKKRPRLSSISPSPPSSPSSSPRAHHSHHHNSSHPALRSSPRRAPKRAPLANRLATTSQQTTLDNFFSNNTRKDNSHNASTGDRARPIKKARLEETTAIEAHTPTTTATTTHQLLESPESPDPLNVISPPRSNERLRTRRRASTLTGKPTTTTPTTTTPKEPIPKSPTFSNRPTARSTRNKAVIIADDAATKTEKDQIHANGQRQQAAPASQAPEKRSLRSHDGGSRSKSELALYFPNYEQIISLEPVKPEFLAPATTVTLLDDLTEPLQITSPSRIRKQRKHADQVSPFGNPLLCLHGVEKVELPQVDETATDTDPLSDDVYFKAHRRHERQEKQLRNIEKERAQHEKIQLDRLLDELQGHDWLRVMGISGITDTEKKLYEPKRDYFVKEVSALIDKFRIWKEEEKRRKLEREKMLLQAAAATAEEEDEQEEDVEMSESEDAKPPSSSCDSSEVDAAAAQQLLQEARSATVTANDLATTSAPATPSKPRRRLVDALTGTPPNARTHQEADVDQAEKPFVSFYPKRHLRDAAFSSSRRGGRNRSAFGQVLPELEEREFQLPPEILTPDLVHAMERRRRRLKRESRGS